MEIIIKVALIELIILAIAIYVINIVYGVKRTTRFIQESQWAHVNYYLHDRSVMPLYVNIFKKPIFWLLQMNRLTTRYGKRPELKFF